MPITPVYCGTDPSPQELESLRKFVKAQKTLVVISSDFCHYGQRFDYNPQFKGKTA